MNKSAVVAWVVTAICAVAALVAVVVRPIHWDRTFAAAVVVGLVAAFYAIKQGRTARLQP
jgi:hypothetical protein